MDARGGKPNTQHVLLCGDVVVGRDPLQVAQVAEGGENEFKAECRQLNIIKTSAFVYFASI